MGSEAGVTPQPQAGALNFNLPAYLLGRPFRLLFRVYLVLTVALPSGSIYGLNFKTPLYLLLIPSALYVHVRDRRRNLGVETGLLFATPALFLLWVLLSQVYGFNAAGALRQYLDILLTFATCWIAVLFAGDTEAGRISLLRTIVFAEVAAGLFKVSLVGYAVIRGIPIPEMVVGLDRIFGVDLMTMDIGDLLGRIQFVSDGLIPVCIFAILCLRNRIRIGFLLSMAMLVLLTLSLFLSYSRYLWAFGLVAVVMGLVLGKKDKLFVVLMLLLVAGSVLVYPLVSGLLAARFTGGGVDESDAIRVEQIIALKPFFLDAPFFGHGLGSYSTQVIRAGVDADTGAKYSYEVQLLALLGQVGLTGGMLLTGYLVFYFRRLWPRDWKEVPVKGAAVVLLALWLAAGLFNPLLLNPVAGVVYVAILCVGTMGSHDIALG